MGQRSADATRSEAGGRDGTPLVFILVKSARSVTRRRHEKAWFHPSTHQRELISGQTASAEYRHRTERGMQTAQPVRSPIPPYQDSRGRQCSPAEKSLLRSQSNLHRGACGRSGACERQRLADLFLVMMPRFRVNLAPTRLWVMSGNRCTPLFSRRPHTSECRFRGVSRMPATLAGHHHG